MKLIAGKALLTICTVFVRVALAQQIKTCSKVDFNREIVNEFSECFEQFLPVLGVKRYSDHSEIRPYRVASQFFLSPSNEGLACVESKDYFQLDENSIIQAAIHVDYKDAGAYVSIIVIDLMQNQEAYVWKYEQKAKWFMVEEKIAKKLPRALIGIRTNKNKNSVLALEYLNVVNTKNQRPECIKDLPPLASTTTVPITLSTTTSPVTTAPPTTAFGDGDGDGNADGTGVDKRSSSALFVILGISLSFIIVVIILVVVFIFVIRPRFSTKVLHVTKPIDEDEDGDRTTPHVQTIPRLHVLHDPINGPYISGVNYIKHLEEDEMGWNGRGQK